MTFPASNLMKQTIAAASHFRPRPVKNVVTGTGDHHGPGLQSKEGHAANRNGLGEKENVANRRIGNVSGDRMQEDVFFPLPVQHRHDSDHDHPSTASMRRKFFKENPRAVYMAVDEKDPRSQFLNASSNAIEDGSFRGSRLVPYSIMKAGRCEARGQKGKNKQSEVVPRAGRDNEYWTSQQAGSRCHRMDENAFRTRPTDFQASIHPSRATAFVNSHNPLDYFLLHRPELAHDTPSFFPGCPPHSRSCHADPDSMDVDPVPLSTPTLNHESRWRRDSLNDDVEMEESGPVVQKEDVVMGGIQVNVHPGQDNDIEMGERTPLFSTYPIQANIPTFPAFFPTTCPPAITPVSYTFQGHNVNTDVRMDDAPITEHREEFHTNLYGTFMDVEIQHTPAFTQPPAPPVVSNTPTCFSVSTGQKPNTPSPSHPSRQRRKTRCHRGTPPYPKCGIHRDRASKLGLAGAHPRPRTSRLHDESMPLGVEVMSGQPFPPPFALFTPTSSSIHPTSASAFPIFPPSAITMAPHYAGPPSSTLAYPSPPSSQRRRTYRYRGTPPYPKTGIHRDRALKSGIAGALPQLRRSEGPLGVEVMFPQPPLPLPTGLATSPYVLPNPPSSTTTMAFQPAGLPPSSPAYPFITNRPHDETLRAEPLAIELGTSSLPSPPSNRRRKTHRHRGTPPYTLPYTPTPSSRTKIGTCQDRALEFESQTLSLASTYSRRGCTTSRTKRNALITGAQLRRRLFST